MLKHISLGAFFGTSHVFQNYISIHVCISKNHVSNMRVFVPQYSYIYICIYILYLYTFYTHYIRTCAKCTCPVDG